MTGLPARTPQARRQPLSYLVTIWPEGHECSDVSLWSLMVRYRGDGRWAVEHGWSSGQHKDVLGTDGRWKIDRRGDPSLRHPLELALRMAAANAALITVNGITAAQALARHEERGCPDR